MLYIIQRFFANILKRLEFTPLHTQIHNGLETI